VTGELAYLSLAEAAELIRAKKLSPVEYATALLARIERHDGKYNAFIALTPERALKASSRPRRWPMRLADFFSIGIMLV
jgi:aspartyl-tRNA(Asn)/glutamyl-tRNA(Gln) amidotransferase subunit A